MATAQLDMVLRHIRKIATKQHFKTLADGQLLQQFNAQNDQGAFATLVQRHGPMVLGVCGNVLGHRQDAEDAFQATFLVLARKAASIRRKDALASWLHGVAYRIAMSVKRAAARRHKHEPWAETKSSKSPSWELAWREVQVVLDEEIQRLSEKYRVVFILCCVEGRSKEEVARQLGIKEGTVSSRLHQARKRLQGRLSRRGITLSAVMAVAALGQDFGRAAVTASLVDTTVGAAFQLAGGKVTAGAVSANAVTLVKGAVKVMTLNQLKIVGALLVASGLLTTAVAVCVRQVRAQKTVATNDERKPAMAAIKAESPKPPEVKGPRVDQYGDLGWRSL